MPGFTLLCFDGKLIQLDAQSKPHDTVVQSCQALLLGVTATHRPKLRSIGRFSRRAMPRRWSS